jgi:hypothetical protein
MRSAVWDGWRLTEMAKPEAASIDCVRGVIGDGPEASERFLPALGKGVVS